DNHGRAARSSAARSRNRHGVRIAPSSGRCDYRRPDFQPDVDVVHHTRDLSVPRSSRYPAAAWKAVGLARSRGVSRMKDSKSFHCFSAAPRLWELSCALFICLSGCTVGPKYKVPVAPMTPNFKEPPPANWKEAQPQDSTLRGNWWEMF